MRPRTLCLGEALVDLICEQPAESFTEAASFVPHVGGATANVAVSAARQGAEVGLAGGVGADAWGAWLLDHLKADGVDLTWFRALEGVPTPLACVILGADGEPSFTIYGEALAAAMEALSSKVEQAVEGFDALFFASNTMVGEVEREVTEHAHRTALELGRPVIVDANLRLERWPNPELAAQVVGRCVPGALLMRTNRSEAEILTGRRDPEEAAKALLDAGAHSVVITLGADGALLAGEHWSRVEGVPAEVRSTVGAGDAFTGVLVAALTNGGYDPAALAEALPRAVVEGARATERWGAQDPKPLASSPRSAA